MSREMTRRKFLGLALIGGGATILASCATPATPETTTPTEGAAEEPTVEAMEEPAAEPTEAPTEAPVPVGLEADLNAWFYTYTEDDIVQILNPLGEEFLAENPGVTITWDVQDWRGRREKVYVATAAGEPPDLFWATSDTIEAYVQKNVALDVTDAFPSQQLTDQCAHLLAEGTDDVVANVLDHLGGIGHLPEQQANRLADTTVVEYAAQEGGDTPAQALLGRRFGRHAPISGIDPERCLEGVTPGRRIEHILAAEVIVHRGDVGLGPLADLSDGGIPEPPVRENLAGHLEQAHLGPDAVLAAGFQHNEHLLPVFRPSITLHTHISNTHLN